MDGVALGIHRAHAVDAGFGGLVGVDLVETYFNNMVVTHIDASGLKVEKNKGFLEVEVHKL